MENSTVLNGSLFKGMLISGCNNLSNRKTEVDSLNVFPVPDGDTGTNMFLTFSNGVAEVNKSGSESLPVIAKTLSRGLLMGARGNSGVILSQIWRGFYTYLKDNSNPEELSVSQVAEALSNGSKLAYRAVMRPVEGTILTVIRESSEAGVQYAANHPDCSLLDYFSFLTAEAKKSLANTPELLPVLKEARVVDSGGSGLTVIFEGFEAYLRGTPVEEQTVEAEAQEHVNEKASGYRTEYILHLTPHRGMAFREEKFRTQLEQIGNAITLITDENGIIKVRMNTMTPGEALSLGQRYGEFDKIQIQNVQDDLLPSIIETPKPQKEFGIIAVAAGDGLKQLFLNTNADYVVSGGQTMNPSTEDFVSAIGKVNARHIFIFPNNGNIIMAAKQAAEVTEGKDVKVYETRSVPQGLSACINFNPDASLEENSEAMQEAIDHVKSGSVTYAIKDTTVDGQVIHAGDYMALQEKNILAVCTSKQEAVYKLIDAMCDEDTEIVTVLKGKDSSDEEAADLENYITDHHDVDVDMEEGGQPVYCWLIGVE